MYISAKLLFNNLIIMTTDEKFDIIINKLTSLENWQRSLENWQRSLEEWQKFLENWQRSLEEWQKNIKEDLLEFKNETALNFEKTNKLLDQAFEKISENISYQDKVTEIEKIIHSRKRNFA